LDRPPALGGSKAAGHPGRCHQCRAGDLTNRPSSRPTDTHQQSLPEMSFQIARGSLSHGWRCSLGSDRAERQALIHWDFAERTTSTVIIAAATAGGDAWGGAGP